MADPTSIAGGSSDFVAYVKSLQAEIADKAKVSAREKVQRVAIAKYSEEARLLVEAAGTEFKNRLLIQYPNTPWREIAEMTINSARLLFFYHGNNSLLAQVKDVMQKSSTAASV